MTKIRINEDNCKGCSLCISFCPMNVLDLSDRYTKRGVRIPYAARIEKCTKCRFCELVCPDFAIEVENDD